MIRLVKLTIDSNKKEAFLDSFNQFKDTISTYPGCKGMRLLMDKNDPQTVFTYSEWESDEALENYRNSELFTKVWPALKASFAGRTEVWSTEQYYDGFSL